MELNIHYKNIQDATKETTRSQLEEKLHDVLKMFGEFEDEDQAVATAHIEHFEKHKEYTVRVQLKIRKKGKEYSFVVEEKRKADLLACMNEVKHDLQAMVRKGKE